MDSNIYGVTTNHPLPEWSHDVQVGHVGVGPVEVGPVGVSAVDASACSTNPGTSDRNQLDARPAAAELGI